MDREQKLQLLKAYREAGLIDKANELTDELLGTKTKASFDELKAKMDEAADKVHVTLDKLAIKMGTPRPSRPQAVQRRGTPVKKPKNVPGFPVMPVIGVRAKKPGIKVGLGPGVCAAANLDNHHIPAMEQVERGKGWIRGTREQLLEILYYIESSVPFMTGDGQAPSECAAVRLASKSWRSKLGLEPNEEIPVPESALK